MLAAVDTNHLSELDRNPEFAARFEERRRASEADVFTTIVSREAKAISEKRRFAEKGIFPPPDGLSLRLVKQRGGIRFAEAQIQALTHRLPCPRHYRIAGVARICRVTAHAKVAR